MRAWAVKDAETGRIIGSVMRLYDTKAGAQKAASDLNHRDKFSDGWRVVPVLITETTEEESK